MTSCAWPNHWSSMSQSVSSPSLLPGDAEVSNLCPIDRLVTSSHPVAVCGCPPPFPVMPLAQYTGLCEGAHYKEQNVCFTPSSRKFKTWGTLCWKPGRESNYLFFSPHYTSHTHVFYNLKIFKRFKFSIQGFRHQYSIFNQMISWFSSPAVLHSACCLLVLSCDHAT